MNEAGSPGLVGLLVTQRGQSAVEHARHDYGRFLAEYGFTEAQARAMVETTADLLDLPQVYDKLELRASPIEGNGLFATYDLPAGDVLAIARIDGQRTAAGRWTNHSPYPNAVFMALDNGDLAMVAVRDIDAGTEVTIDYRQAALVNGAGLQPIPAEVESTLRQKIERLEEELRRLPQVEIPVKHYFVPGVYAREITIPKGATLTGKIHKYRHINIMLKGEMSVLTEDGMVRVKAPYTYVSPPGTKRAGFAHEETVWTCILSTHGVDLSEVDRDELEPMFVVESDADYIKYLKQHALALEGVTP